MRDSANCTNADRLIVTVAPEAKRLTSTFVNFMAALRIERVQLENGPQSTLAR